VDTPPPLSRCCRPDPLRCRKELDVRYGGLYELLAVGREYDSDRLLARFAVVQRARGRMVTFGRAPRTREGVRIEMRDGRIGNGAPDETSGGRRRRFACVDLR